MTKPIGPTRERIKQAHKHDGGYLPPEVSHGARRQHGRVIPRLEAYLCAGTLTSDQYLAALKIERCCQTLAPGARIASYGSNSGVGTPWNQRNNSEDLARQDAVVLAGSFLREARHLVADERAWKALLIVVAHGSTFEEAGVHVGYKRGSSAKISAKKLVTKALDRIVPLLAAWRAATQ